MRSASFGMISWRHSWNLLLARSQVAQRVTPVESHGPSEAALLVVNSRVSHKKDMDIMGHNVCGWCVVFCRAQKLEQHPGSLEPAVGLQSWANYLDKNVFFCCAQCVGVCKVSNWHDSRLHQSSA